MEESGRRVACVAGTSKEKKKEVERKRISVFIPFPFSLHLPCRFYGKSVDGAL